MHIGGLRTAFVNYLFAKKYDGDFILRIEDTDQKRVVKNATENIQEVLEYFDLPPDEGPFRDGGYGPYYQVEFGRHRFRRPHIDGVISVISNLIITNIILFFSPRLPSNQSQRTELYRKYAHQLLEQGLAYRCFCDETLLKLLRDQAKKNRTVVGYDNRCRKLSKQQIDENLAKGMPYSIRFRMTDEAIKFDDLVKGEICVNLALSEPDFVILKSDQYPTYHLANVVDDHLMKVSHVVRGLEWLKSTPKHLMLYNAFGWQPPVFAHLPLIFNPTGTKLSKRNEDINMINLAKNGIFKEAIFNYLVTIGGGFKTDYTKNNQCIYDLEYFKRDFNETLLRSSAAKFDLKKIKFFNHLTMQHLLATEPQQLVERMKGMILSDFADADLRQLEFEPMCRLIRQALYEKIQTYQEIKAEYSFFWTESFERDESLTISFDIGQIKPELLQLFDTFEHEITPENTKAIKEFCKSKDLEYGPFLQLIRWAIMGKIRGAKIRELYELLTKELFIKRLDRGLDKITVTTNSEADQTN